MSDLGTLTLPEELPPDAKMEDVLAGLNEIRNAVELLRDVAEDAKPAEDRPDEPGNDLADLQGQIAALRARLYAQKEEPNRMLPEGLPPGVPLPFAGNTVPNGYLLCDGAAHSRTTYAALFAAIGTLHGSGDGSTTFNVPDGGGKAFRGWIEDDATFGTVGDTGGVETSDLVHAHYSLLATGNPTFGAEVAAYVDAATEAHLYWQGASDGRTIQKPDDTDHEIDNRGPYSVVKFIIKT